MSVWRNTYCMGNRMWCHSPGFLNNQHSTPTIKGWVFFGDIYKWKCLFFACSATERRIVWWFSLQHHPVFLFISSHSMENASSKLRRVIISLAVRVLQHGNIVSVFGLISSGWLVHVDLVSALIRSGLWWERRKRRESGWLGRTANRVTSNSVREGKKLLAWTSNAVPCSPSWKWHQLSVQI